jgi:hypothetical protein
MREHHERVDHLPGVTRRVAEIGVDAAEAGDRLSYELDTPGAQPVIGGATIVDDKHEGGMAPFATIPRMVCAVAASSTGSCVIPVGRIGAPLSG